MDETHPVLVSPSQAYKSLFRPGVRYTKTSNDFQSHGLPARATLTATLESRGWMTPRGCKAVPGCGVSGWVYPSAVMPPRGVDPRGKVPQAKGTVPGWDESRVQEHIIHDGHKSSTQPAAVTRCP